MRYGDLLVTNLICFPIDIVVSFVSRCFIEIENC